jgi:hypothetical protein
LLDRADEVIDSTAFCANAKIERGHAGGGPVIVRRFRITDKGRMALESPAA